MKIKKSKGERAFQVFNYAFLMLITLVCLYPVWYVAVASFSNSNALTQHSGLLFRPIGFSIDAYKKVFQNPMIGKGYLNTLFILIIGVFFWVLISFPENVSCLRNRSCCLLYSRCSSPVV